MGHRCAQGIIFAEEGAQQKKEKNRLKIRPVLAGHRNINEKNTRNKNRRVDLAAMVCRAIADWAH